MTTWAEHVEAGRTMPAPGCVVYYETPEDERRRRAEASRRLRLLTTPGQTVWIAGLGGGVQRFLVAERDGRPVLLAMPKLWEGDDS